MSQKKVSITFRPALEMLERRELMAADLSGATRVSWLLASATLGAEDLPAIHGVGSWVVAPASNSSTVINNASSASAAGNATLSWINSALQDLNLRNLVWLDTQKDGVLDRAEMLGVFAQAGKDGAVTAVEFADLRKIVANNKFFVGLDYVQVLATHVVTVDQANGTFLGAPLGNLAAGSTASQLNKLVDKWFRGADHPLTMSGVTYQTAAGSLFPHAPIYTDVRQGMVGDCYFLASMAVTSVVNPKLITSMFIINGDSTYTVRLYHDGKPDYVTVDSMLPVNRYGNYVYDNIGLNVGNKTAPLWAALAEKAYAQMDASGWLRVSLGDHGSNSYDAISGGYMFEALAQITAKRPGYSAVDKNTFLAEYNAGALITFGTSLSPPDHTIVPNHAYAVVNYNKSSQQVTLFNPWGLNNGSYAPGLVTLNWTQMKQDFFAMEYAV